MSVTAYVLFGCIAAIIVGGLVVAELNHRAHEREGRQRDRHAH